MTSRLPPALTRFDHPLRPLFDRPLFDRPSDRRLLQYIFSVETEEQLAALSGVGCDEVQGFLLGRPMPAEQAAILAAGSGLVEAKKAA